jgi:hypothetical protein
VAAHAGGFEEPGGISSAGDKLYIADTNSHTIKVVDLETNAIQSLMLSGLEKLRSPGGSWSGDTIQVTKPIVIHPGDTAIIFDVLLPEDYKMFPDSPSRILFSVNDGGSHQLVDRPQSFPIEWRAGIAGNTTLNVMVQLYYCHARDNALCFFKESLFTIPVEVSTAAVNREIRIVHNPLSVG